MKANVRVKVRANMTVKMSVKNILAKYVPWINVFIQISLCGCIIKNASRIQDAISIFRST